MPMIRRTAKATRLAATPTAWRQAVGDTLAERIVGKRNATLDHRRTHSRHRSRQLIASLPRRVAMMRRRFLMRVSILFQPPRSWGGRRAGTVFAYRSVASARGAPGGGLCAEAGTCQREAGLRSGEGRQVGIELTYAVYAASGLPEFANEVQHPRPGARDARRSPHEGEVKGYEAGRLLAADARSRGANERDHDAGEAGRVEARRDNVGLQLRVPRHAVGAARPSRTGRPSPCTHKG